MQMDMMITTRSKLLVVVITHCFLHFADFSLGCGFLQEEEKSQQKSEPRLKEEEK